MLVGVSTDGRDGEVGEGGTSPGQDPADPTVPATTDVEPDGSGAAEGPAASVVFRPSPLVVLVALAFAFCATPFAFGAPLFWLIYLIPVGMIVWAARTRTVVDPRGITTRRVLGRRTVSWSEISSLRLTKRTRVRAVLSGGAELTLPAVHVRHLPQIAAASGGRLPDPSAPAPGDDEG